MRIVALLFLLVILAAIVVTTTFVLRAAARRQTKLDSRAQWRARSTALSPSWRSQTKIEIVLETRDGRTLERRTVDILNDLDGDYDRRYLNTMEDARNRAFLLNTEE